MVKITFNEGEYNSLILMCGGKNSMLFYLFPKTRFKVPSCFLLCCSHEGDGCRFVRFD